MHKIQTKKFTLEDFSYEHLDDVTLDTLNYVITQLEYDRRLYLKANDKKYWWQMIQLLPSSYNQTRNVMMNYEVLANIYRQRKNHKLDEWREFCKWIERLPYNELITKSNQTKSDLITKEQMLKMIDILIKNIDDPTMCDTFDMECWLNEQREKLIKEEE